MPGLGDHAVIVTEVPADASKTPNIRSSGQWLSVVRRIQKIFSIVTLC